MKRLFHILNINFIRCCQFFLLALFSSKFQLQLVKSLTSDLLAKANHSSLTRSTILCQFSHRHIDHIFLMSCHVICNLLFCIIQTIICRKNLISYQNIFAHNIPSFNAFVCHLSCFQKCQFFLSLCILWIRLYISFCIFICCIKIKQRLICTNPCKEHFFLIL